MTEKQDEKKRVTEEELAKVAGGKPGFSEAPPPCGCDAPEPEDLPDGGTQTPFQQ